jgi:outer membrane protein assembly factor BamB
MIRKLLVVSLVTVLTVAVSAQQGGEWPQWRGPHRNGAAAFTVPPSWPAALTKQWEVAVGGGHSSPVIAGNRVFVHARQGEREITRALDLKTGKEIWRNDYNAPYTMNPAAGRVFAFGISGILSAHDVATGKLLWRTAAPPAPPEYGTAMSPIAEGGLVIAHTGGQGGGALTAFEPATGAIRWRWSGDGPAYASPVVADIADTRHVITQTQNSIVSVNAVNGQLLWQLPFKTPHEQNAVTPVVVGDTVIYSGLDNGTTAVRVFKKGSTWATSPVWKNEQVSMYMSSPVADGSTLYGLSHRNRGQFFALDLASGKTLWTTPGREGENASILLAGKLLLVSTTNAELIVARADPSRFEELERYTIADSAVWAHPAIARNMIVVKDADKVTCWTV